jgi:hypothetical protein
MAVAPIFTAYNSGYLSAKNTGIGNVLFQLASTYGISRKVNKEVSYHHLIQFCDKLRTLYGLNHGDTIFRNFCKVIRSDKWVDYYEPPVLCHTYLPEMVAFCANNAFVQTHGYMECYEYFNDISNEFIDLIRPDTASIEHLSESYPFLFDSSVNTVAIHIRLNEYRKMYNVDYYVRAIAHMKSRIENPKFLIFTDDPTSDFSSFGLTDYTIMTTKYDYMDLWAMSMCKNFICSFSTFCIWACMLNENPDAIILGNKEEPHWKFCGISTIRPPRSTLL